MNKPDTKAQCCSDRDDESGCRNNYFDGKRLSTDSFRVEQRYFLDRRHLLNRAIFGWGVVYGLSVDAKDGQLTIGAGLALDPLGRELVQAAPKPLAIDDLLDIEIANKNKNPHPVNEKVCWLLSAHYAERRAGPTPVVDPCRCEHQQWERTCETVRYSLQPIDCGDCCVGFDCELNCECGTGDCCDRYAESTHPKRGGCRCLCESLTRLTVGGEAGPWRDVEEACGHVCVDVGHPVALACLEVTTDAQGRRTIGAATDACGPRRLVKRNDLLFDLVRGCDLTRIDAIGWQWHRPDDPVPLDKFSEAFGDVLDAQRNYVTRDFWVQFSRPVRRETLLPDCFAITALSREREGGWWRVFRVPIVGVEVDAGNQKATMVVDGGWVRDAVRGDYNIFLNSETTIEIEVRGDFIVDCNGQTVDANAVGRRAVPTGNGTPGGTFLSTFRVAQKGA